MNRLLIWLSGHLPLRVIMDGMLPYLERYFLFRAFGWRFYLHRFVASDPDRGVHDHPWRRAFSLILVGPYIEETRYGSRVVRRFNALTGTDFHRVVLPTDAHVWTLFFHGPRAKDWGFMTPFNKDGGFVYQSRGSADDGNWWETAPKGIDHPDRQ